MSLSARMRRTIVAASALAVASSVVGTSMAAAASPTYYAFGGSGYGSTASLGTLVQSGATSAVSLCSLKDVTNTNTAAATNLGVLGTVGAVRSTTKGVSQSSTTRTATTTTSTGSLSLLAGIIKGSAVTSQAVAKHSPTGYALTGSTRVTGLKIGGVSVAAAPAKNTTINLPSKLGTVILNHQTSGTNKYGTHQVGVDALYITVNSGNLLGLPAGRVVVGHATASLHDAVHARPIGSAYATRIQTSRGVVSSGPTAASSLPCAGSNQNTISSTTAQVSVPRVATIGAAGSSAASSDTATATNAHTSASVGNVSLLGGIVKAKALAVKTSANKPSGKAVTLSSSGTTVSGLAINGKAVSVGTGENQKINITGVGTLWLRKTIRSSTTIQAYGLQLQLLHDKAGLKAGAIITVGYSTAGVANQ